MSDEKIISIMQPSSKELVDIRPGDTIRVHYTIQEGGRERTQAFEGLVIAKKHGKGPSATITVRKISFGIGVERIFPLHSPTIEKIEVVKRTRVRRAKLYYVRKQAGKRIRKRKLLELPVTGVAEEATEAAAEGQPPTEEAGAPMEE